MTVTVILPNLTCSGLSPERQLSLLFAGTATPDIIQDWNFSLPFIQNSDETMDTAMAFYLRFMLHRSVLRVHLWSCRELGERGGRGQISLWLQCGRNGAGFTVTADLAELVAAENRVPDTAHPRRRMGLEQLQHFYTHVHGCSMQ